MPVRKLPFGYEMCAGQITLCRSEATTLQFIFKQYAMGSSYSKLVEELKEQGIPYDVGKTWNKNMVARILTDIRYTGVDGYPVLIDTALYDKVNSKRACKVNPAKKSEAIKAIQSLAVCATCESLILRQSPSHGRERWCCPQCKSITSQVSDVMLMENIEGLLGVLEKTPTDINAAMITTNSTTLTLLQKSLDEAMVTEDFDENVALRLVLDLAAAQFDAIGSEDYESERLRCLFQQAKCSEKCDSNLLRETTATVFVYPDGAVSLKLKNGQRIGRLLTS